MDTRITPVILSGGAGTRLWPQSRGTRAKQFLRLTGGPDSLFQQCLGRVTDDTRFAPPMVLCGDDHVPLVVEQARGRPLGLLIEPMARNTAPAIALAVVASAPDALLLVLPSDQMIGDLAAFHHAVDRAASAARDGWLVTFGITPDRPETGYGYIASGAALSDGVFAAIRFIEKPPLADAQAMLDAGGHSWNAGIFLFRAGDMAAAMQQHCPLVWNAANTAVAGARRDGAAVYAAAQPFAAAPAISIDYAVMELAERVAVVPVAMDWTDLGSWASVRAANPADNTGNVVSGPAFVLDSRNCLIRSDRAQVSVIGMDGVAVIVDGDEILVMPLDRAQDVRQAAEHARARAANSQSPPKS